MFLIELTENTYTGDGFPRKILVNIDTIAYFGVFGKTFICFGGPEGIQITVQETPARILELIPTDYQGGLRR